jgi:Pyruvate/2-oxoacid:ferredoxin oxidoreductase delta subunit
VPVTGDSLIVFISPVHGFNYPPVMLKFLRRFPKGNSKVILMDTRAGMLIGKFNLPGISGAAFLLASLILKIKGYRIFGMKSVDLPSNWMSLHPGLNDKTIRFLHERHKLRVIHFGEKVLSGEKAYLPVFEMIADILVTPVSLAYYFVGRFFFAKTFYASGDCNNCDICINNCPVRAIIKVKDRPYWTFRCESCMHCMGNCPKKCIQTAHGFVAAVCLLSSLAAGLFFRYFEEWFFTIPGGMIRFAVKSVLIILILGISYRLAHLLMRFRFFERLVVYTSLTRYKFWGKRYKALKNY